MNIRTFASGSRGNAALVWQGGTYILVDAGISLRRLEKSLAELSVSVCQLSAILLTHEHTDHISGLPTLVKRYPQIPIVTSGGTARSVALRNRVTEVTQLEVGRTFEIGELEVTSFETPHDVAESVGFTFFDGKRKLGYATDLGHVSPIVKRALLGADTVLLESNHDRDMLWYGAYPYKLKQRIAGLYGHLSNEDSGEFAAQLCDSGASRIILAHLSDENNRPETALESMSQLLVSRGHARVEVTVAPVGQSDEMYEV